MLRKLSYRVIVAGNVNIPEPGLSSLLAAAKRFREPGSLLSEMRKNPHLSRHVYPTMGEIKTAAGIRKIPALVNASDVPYVPMPTFQGLCNGQEVSFHCLGTSYEADARALVSASPALRSVPGEVLSDPVELINWLADKRKAIARECGPAKDFSLTYLTQALTANGIIPDQQVFQRLASARNLYDHSLTLQGIPADVLAQPIGIITWLHQNRTAIAAEASSQGTLSLGTLVLALESTGRISGKQKLHRLAGARDLYDRAPTLQGLPAAVLEQPIKLIDWLHQNQAAIAAEASAKDTLALATLVNALQSAGRIPDEQTFVRLAGARDLYDRSPTLQSIPAETLKTPLKLIDWLHQKRTLITAEASTNGTLALATLIGALQSAGRISYKQTFNLLASSRDLYDRSRTLQAIPPEVLDEPIKVIDWLHQKRAIITAEASTNGALALATLIGALQSAGKISAEQKFYRLGSGKDLYAATPGLKEGKDIFRTIDEVIIFIDRRRAHLFRRDKKAGQLSYAHILCALEAGGRIEAKINMRILRYEAAAADYARRREADIRARIAFAVKNDLTGNARAIADPAADRGWAKHIDLSGFLSVRGGKPLSRSYINTILKWAQRLYGAEAAGQALVS